MAAAATAKVHKIPCASLSNSDAVHNVHVREYTPSVSTADQQRFPVLLVHALTRQSGDFEKLVSALTGAGFKVATWDVVGRGDSDYAQNAMDYGYPQVWL